MDLNNLLGVRFPPLVSPIVRDYAGPDTPRPSLMVRIGHAARMALTVLRNGLTTLWTSVRHPYVIRDITVSVVIVVPAILLPILTGKAVPRTA